MSDAIKTAARPPVRGVEVDGQTRCRHWRSPRDVIAIRMPCCNAYWACSDCHAELAGHPPARRAVNDPAPAVLCGACGHEMTVRQYLDCCYACPRCGSAFNPGCALHHELYFR